MPIDPPWDPLDHPHDKDGKFVKKGHGTYTVLKDLSKGKFGLQTGQIFGTNGTVLYGSDADLPAGVSSVKVGGFTIEAPNHSHAVGAAHSIDYLLKPGESVHTTQGKSNLVVIKHADGSATTLKPTGHTLPPEKGPVAAKFDQLKAFLEKNGTKVSEHPVDSHDAPPTEPKTSGPVTSVGELIEAPVGAQFTFTSHGETKVLEKQPMTAASGQGGSWKNVATGTVTESWQWYDAIKSGKAAWGSSKTPPATDSQLSTHAHLEFHQGSSNKFYASTVVKHADGSASHVTQYGSTLPGAHKSTVIMNHASHADALSAHSLKVSAKKAKGYQANHPAMVELDKPFKTQMTALQAAGKHAKSATPEPDESTVPEEKPAPPKLIPSILHAPEPTPVEKTLAGGAKVVGSVLHHPSGSTIDLAPGSVLHQHTKVKESFAVVTPDGSVTKVTSGGSTQKAPDSLVAVLATNYEPVHTVSATVPVPGTSISISTGQSLYSSKGNKNFYALVQDGQIKQLISKDTGEAFDATPAQLKNWQASLDKGTLVHAFSAGAPPVAATKAKSVGTKAKSTAAPKVKKSDEWKQGLPSKVKGPAGEITVNPGESVWQDASNTYVVGAAGNVLQVFNADGSEPPYWHKPKGAWSPKKLSDSGFKPVAYGGEQDSLALPDGTAKDQTLAQFLQYAQKKGKWYDAPAASEIRAKYLSLNDGKIPTADALADDSLYALVADVRTTLQHNRQLHLANMDSSQKARTARTTNQVDLFLQMLTLLRKAKSGQEMTPSDDAAVAAVKAKAAKEGAFAGNLMGVASQQLITAHALAKFGQQTKGLGFDPAAGTHADYLAYVVGKGAPHAEGMSTDDLKAWTLADLGAPNTSPETKTTLVQKAKTNIQVSAMSVHAQAALAKKKAILQATADPGAEIATKKLAVAYKQLADMHESYESSAGDKLAWSGEWGWSVTTPGGGHAYLSDLDAVDELGKGDWKPSGEKIGSPVQKVAKQIIADWGAKALSSPTVDMLQSMGAQNTAGWNAVKMRSWVAAHLLGDQVWKWNVETNNGMNPHPLASTHDGSPLTQQGKLARQALSNWLHAQPWYVPGAGDDELNVEQKQAYRDNLGLTEVSQLIHGTPEGMLTSWLNRHKDLPPPATGGVNTDTAVVDIGGVEVVVPKGAKLVKQSDGTTFLLTPDYFQTFEPTSDLSSWTMGPQKPYDESMGDFEHDYAAQIALGAQDLTPVFATTVAETTKLKANKPKNVPQQIWDATLGAEEGGPEWASLVGHWATADQAAVDTAVLVGYFHNGTSGSLTNSDRAALAQAPETIRRLMAWALTAHQDDTKQGSAALVIDALVARARAGEYLDPSYETHPLPTGVLVNIPPGGKLVGPAATGNSKYAILLENATGGWTLDGTGKVSNILPTYSISSWLALPVLKESLAKLTPDKAKADGFNFSDDAWFDLNESEGEKVWPTGLGEEGAAAYNYKQHLASHPDLAATVPGAASLTEKIASLPVGVKALAVEAAKDGDADQLSAIVWKVGKGAYVQAPSVSTHPGIPQGAPYEQLVAQGKVSQEAIAAHWTAPQKNAFAEDFGLNKYTVSASEIAAKLAELKSSASPAPTKTSAALDDTASIQLTKISKALGGMHSKQAYADQFGEEWMAKFFKSDPNAQARVDAEHYANVIGRLMGFSQPRTLVRELDGNYSYVQHLAPATGSLAGKDWSDLSEDQLANAMAEHVLDWSISNHDSHPENLLAAPDGKTIIGIDKGQAFKHLHDDKLAVGYKPPENPVPVWYDNFYHALQAGKVPKELADRVAERVMLRAYHVASRLDDRYQQLVEAALEKRGKATMPAKYPTKAQLVQAAMDRKHAALQDFNDFYSKLWQKAGWKWEIDPESFGKKVGEAHIQNGPQFANEVKDTNALGKALFFNTRDLADSNLMFAPMEQKGGGTTLLGHGHVTSDADKILTSWLSEHVEGPKATKNSKSSSPVITAPPGSEMPGIAEAHNAIVAWLKTVATHYTDGAYNMQTVENSQLELKQLKAKLAKTIEARDADPSKPIPASAGNHVKGIPGFSTLEQQDAWIAAAQELLDRGDKVQKAMDAKQPVDVMFPEVGKPPKGGWQPIVYTPSKNLGQPGGIAEKWAFPEGDEIVKTTDGGHYMVQDGKKSWISKQDYLNASNAPGAKKVPLATEAPDAPAGEASWTNTKTGTQWVKQPDGSWAAKGGSADGSVIQESDLQDLLSASPDEFVYDSGQKVEEKTVDVQVVGKKLKVTHHPAMIHSGAMDLKDGKMKEVKSGPSTEFQTGFEYAISHDNVTVRYRPHTESGVAAAQRGLLQFEVKNWDGSHKQIDDVLDTLHLIGLDVTPADMQSMELQYWRQMVDVLQARSEAKQSGKYSDMLKKIAAARSANPNMSQAEELELLKNAWATVLGKAKVESVDHTPKFVKWFGQTGGRPSWIRANADVAAVKKAYANGTSVPIAGLTGGNTVDTAVSIAKSGGMLSSEERARILGKVGHTMSPSADQGSYGSSGFVFLRQNLNPFAYHSGISALVDPMAAANYDNYSFPGDSFGNFEGRKNTSFDLANMLSHKGHSNEIMVKHSAGVRRLACNTAQLRTQLIAALKKEGISEINGMPVEDFVVTDWKQAMKDIWAEIEKEHSND